MVQIMFVAEPDDSIIYTVSVGAFSKSPLDGSNVVGIACDLTAVPKWQWCYIIHLSYLIKCSSVPGW